MSFGTFHTISADLLAQATPAERVEYDRALKRHLALQSPLDMALMTTPRTKEYPHITLLNTLLVALVEHRLYKAGPCGHVSVSPSGDVLPSYPEEPASEPRFHPDVECFVEPWADGMEKLFVTMPPRHGKSFLISEHLPAWFIARYPEWRVIFASYEAEFAAKFGAKGRDILEAHGELFGLSVNPSARAGNLWNLSGRRGGMKTAGANGPITGSGGHILICDDPIKNQEEALSEVEREKLWDWWYATFSTRGEPGAVQLLVHTRWFEDDLGGRLMAEEGDEWFHVDLPALQPEGEDEETNKDILSDTGVHSGAGNPLCRAAGEALCPERYSASWLEQKRAKNIGWFEALYQQRPASSGSGIFTREAFRYWVRVGTARDPIYALGLPNGTQKFVDPKSCYHFQTVDLAASEKTWADYTVFSTWACTPDKELLLVDRFRERIESDEHLKAFEDNLARLKREGIPVKMAGVEKATFGLSLIKLLIKRRVVPIRQFIADKDKTTRALPAGEACSNGILYWPKNAPWLKVWESEHLKFPKTTHDDQVDTTAYAVHMLYFSGLNFRGRKPDQEPVTMQERVDAKVEALSKKKRRGQHRHPELGRIW